MPPRDLGWDLPRFLFSGPQTVHFGGWACPGCGRCFSPSVTECPHCLPEVLPGLPADCCPLQPGSGAVAFHRCPTPKAGGLCGCDEDDDAPRDCLRARCDC